MATQTANIAAVQMNAAPAPTTVRLARATRIIENAVAEKAQLILLPELFNTGYEYSPQNYHRAETPNGPTLTWMKTIAAKYGIHVGGSLLIKNGADIYNTFYLFAPTGKSWHYEKNYPWIWERAYFRGGKTTTIADTQLGRFGMMICWDIAHPRLWLQYAGKVDAILVASCPPALHDAVLNFPNGKTLSTKDANPILKQIYATSHDTFGGELLAQARWLGVPVINTTGTGRFISTVPAPRLSLVYYLLTHPTLWPQLIKANQITIESGYFNETYIADQHGKRLSKVPAEQENFALTALELPTQPVAPSAEQPRFNLSVWNYIFEAIGNLILPIYYRMGLYAAFRTKETHTS